jgi:hypothetical protein
LQPDLEDYDPNDDAGNDDSSEDENVHLEDENVHLIDKYSPNILRPIEFLVEHKKKLKAAISVLGYRPYSSPITCDEDLLNYCNHKSSDQNAPVGTHPSPIADECHLGMPQFTLAPSVLPISLPVVLPTAPIRGKIWGYVESKMKRHQIEAAHIIYDKLHSKVNGAFILCDQPGLGNLCLHNLT